MKTLNADGVTGGQLKQCNFLQGLLILFLISLFKHSATTLKAVQSHLFNVDNKNWSVRMIPVCLMYKQIAVIWQTGKISEYGIIKVKENDNSNVENVCYLSSVLNYHIDVNFSIYWEKLPHIWL